jgi:diguanylate cyclase (GGDEF)-like protein/PAS domain S-box-containing protein
VKAPEGCPAGPNGRSHPIWVAPGWDDKRRMPVHRPLEGRGRLAFSITIYALVGIPPEMARPPSRVAAPRRTRAVSRPGGHGRGEGGRQRWRAALLVAIVGAVGTTGVTAGAWYWRTRNDRQAQASFRSAAATVGADVTRGLLGDSDLLAGSAALLHQGVVSRSQYVGYLQAIGFGTDRFPGLEGVGLFDRLTPAAVPDFLASLRAAGIAASVDPPGRRPVYCLGSYADWSHLRTTVPLYGYDVCTVPSIARALAAAAATGRQQVLRGALLGRPFAADLLLVQPVYAAGAPGPSPTRVQGWVVAFVDGDRMLRSLVPAASPAFVVYAGSGGHRAGPPVLQWPPGAAAGGRWSLTRTVEAYGPWTIRFRGSAGVPEQAAGLVGPLSFLVIGLVAVALLVALLLSQLGARRKAEEAVDRATRSLQAREERFRKLVASSSDLIFILDERGRMLYANPVAERLTGAEARDADANGERTGTDGADGEPTPPADLLALIHPDDRPKAVEAFRRDVARPGAHFRATYRFRTVDGEWRIFEGRVSNYLDDPAVGGLVVNATDVTDSTHLTRALRTLGQGNQVLVHASDEATLLAETCRTITDAGGYALAWVGYAEEEDGQPIVHPAASSGTVAYLDEIVVRWDDSEHGRGPAGTAIRTGAIQVLEDVRQTPAFGPWCEVAERYGLLTICALPLVVGGRCLGALLIYAGEPGAFGPAEVELLGQLADALAYGIGRIRDATALRSSEERFRSLASSAPIGILEIENGQVVYANAKLAAIAGRSVESMLGVGWIEAIHPDDRELVLGYVPVLRAERSRITTRFRVQRLDGDVRHVRMSAAPRGEAVDDGYVVTVEDVTDEVHAHEELTYQAFHDTLTGLPNRELFLDRLDQDLAWRKRSGSNIAVLFLDLDRFKIVNDGLGHATGDAVLKEVGQRLARTVRAGETAARFSGDEFIFIIKDVADAEDAEAAARRLLDALQEPISTGAQYLTVTASVGVVVPGPHADAATVLRDADTAMYQAKTSGRNRYELFDEELHRRSVLRLAIEADLREALSRHEFELYYQPVVDPATGQPRGAEALIRWRHPERGIVSPLDFIPVAEESGLIRPIGAWVFEQAVAQLAAWDDDPAAPSLEVLSVNLSARQLDDPETPRLVRASLVRHGLSPSRICVEITESTVMSDDSNCRRAVSAFEELGLRVAIDDFGTGYSSLAYLHSLPVTTLKIDRAFVNRLGAVDDSRPVVQAIVGMAHAMGLRVIAEGVADGERQRVVAELGCDLAQGYYWSPPLAAAEFETWWAVASAGTAGRSASPVS